MSIKSKQITEAEAIHAMSAEDADFYPFLVINEDGKKLVDEWVERVAERKHNMDAWYSRAEQSMSDGDGIIEMGRTMTKSGNPETLTLEGSEHFDWMIIE